MSNCFEDSEAITIAIVEQIKWNSTPKCPTLAAVFFKDSINVDAALMFPMLSSFSNIHCNLLSGITEYIRVHMLVFTGVNTCTCV